MGWWSKIMGPTYNHFWDEKDPAKPLAYSNVCNTLSLVPGNATRTEPPACQEGTVPCWDGKRWVVKLDWRQEKLYEKATGKLTGYPTVDVDTAYLKEHYTTTPPSTPYDKWEGDGWVTDLEAQRADKIAALNVERKKLVAIAAEEISTISDIVLYKEDAGEEDLPEYEALYKSWRLYRGKLLSMKFTTGDETFPDQPTKLDDFMG